MMTLGWTLLHFLWQGAVIAAALALFHALFGRSLRAQTRYATSCAALALMTAAPVITFALLSRTGEASNLPLSWTVPLADGPRILLQLLPWISWTWMAGVAAFAIRLAIGWRAASRMRRITVRPAPLEWQQAFERLLDRMGVQRRAHLLVSALVETPAVIGWLQPVVLMPAGALSGLPAEQVLGLLAHEIGHVLRHDFLANLLQSAAEALLFYHPAVWWVSGQVRQEREQCCDDLAVEAAGVDVFVYARALAEIESSRPGRLKTALAADGASLLVRIRRLIGYAPSISQMLPGPAAMVALPVLWLVGMAAVILRAAPAPAIHLTPPVISALLFDPVLEPPHAAAQVRVPAPRPQPAQPSGPAAAPDNQHGHRLDFGVAYLTRFDEPMIPLQTSPEFKLFLQDARFERVTIGLSGELTDLGVNPSSQRLLSSLPAVAFEMWAEDTYATYIEPGPAHLASKIDREPGKITVHRSRRDDLRKLSLDYPVVIETLPEPGAYRVSFSQPAPPPPATAVAAPQRLVMPAFPVPQILRSGDSLRVELYRDPQSGRTLVDYIHLGPLNQIVPRNEAPHDAGPADTGFTFAHPQVEINGLKQDPALLPETLRGPRPWLYLPGHGRYTLSLTPGDVPNAHPAGEVSGNALLFSDGANIFQIKCSEPIAAGSGSYRIYMLKDPSWLPPDSSDQDAVQIGSTR